MIARDDVVTLHAVESDRAVRPIGFVSAAATRPRNRLRATFRSLGMLVGLSPGELLGDAEQLRADALEVLRRNAGALGANAVLGLEFDVSEGDDGSCKVVAFGQAVMAEKLAPADAP